MGDRPNGHDPIRSGLVIVQPGVLAVQPRRNIALSDFEAWAAAQLHHPNTVAVFDTGEHDGRPFVVMELVEGSNLADRLRADGPFTASEATAVAATVLDALAAAHDQGLVHRDVKPSKVLLSAGGGVKLADFGIAVDLAADATLTDLGQVLGSPRYLAPERATGPAATAASDVYSAGIMLFEALSGRAPFEGDNAVATLLAHQQQPVPHWPGSSRPLLRSSPAWPSARSPRIPASASPPPAR